MINLARPVFALSCLLILVAPGQGAAQHHMDMQQSQSGTPYRPGLGDLMTAFVQPRHTKLGLAGNARNWPYAGYELSELKEAFDDVARLVPKHDNLPIPALIAATVNQPMAALKTAIEGKDTAAFGKAYADLTAACNACHQSAGHSMIVIQEPGASPYPDQDFRTPQK